jgi:transcriptional regulator with XRE-family HTH domain
MTAPRPLTRQEQLAKLVRDCRHRLDPAEFPIPDSDTGGPRKRQRRARRVTIEQVASQSGYSYGWHSALERGRDEGYSDDFLNTVATILKMNADETSMLFSLALRRRGAGAPEEDLRESRVIQWALDEVSCPAFIVDSAWDILSFNKPTAEWFPWVHGGRPNFMRWAFTAPEARTMLHNWTTEWGPQLWAEMQYALARQPENAKLKALVSGILASSRAARLINEHPLNYINSDGKRRRVKVPAMGDKIRVVEQIVFAPLRAPASRIMMIVPLDDQQR